MKRSNKKGFTIVELVIVIAIIAVLAAVLIPTFAGVIRKAKESADIKAVREMNTALAIESAEHELGLFEMFDALVAKGISAENYKPLTDGRTFYWDPALKAVLYVDGDKNVLFPTEHTDVVYEPGVTVWQSLTLSIAHKAPEGYSSDSALAAATTITVKNGEQLAYVIDAVNKGKTNTNLTINVDGSIDMMGATFYIPTVENGRTLNIIGTNNAKISNATAVDVAKMGDGVTNGHDGQYGSGLIGQVKGNVTISDITFDNLNVRNLDVGNAALLFGSISGKATIENVKILNSTLIAHHNMGALVGYTAGVEKLVIKGTNLLKNVDIKTVGGRSGFVFGYFSRGAAAVKVNDGATIKLEDCTNSIYMCDRNKAGTYGGVTITGVNSNGTSIDSWETLGNGNVEGKTREFYNNAYQGNSADNTPYTYIVIGQ